MNKKRFCFFLGLSVVGVAYSGLSGGCAHAYVQKKNTQPARRIALVYQGAGACEQGCSKAAAELAERAGLAIKYVGLRGLTPEMFKNAAVWIQPGGDALELAHESTPEEKQLLKDFVAGGGGYLGFCAGAFFADATVDDEGKVQGLGIIPGATGDLFPQDTTAKILALDWNGQKRHIFFEEGAFFQVPQDASVKVLARYGGGQVATIQARFGSGHVVVTGAHPEALDAWKEAVGLDDPDGPDQDLADDMMSRAIGAGAFSHH